MKFSLLHKGVTYLLAGLGLFSLTLGSELAPPVMLLIFVGFFASWFTGPSVYERKGYTAAWNLIVVGGLVVQVLRGFTGSPIIALGIEFAALLQLSRLFHRRTARDHQHIQALAFLHLIAATVLSTGLDYAFAFVGFVVVLPWMLALTHLRTEIEGHYAQGQVAEDAPLPPVVRRVLKSRRIAGPRFLAGTAALSVPLFVATAGFFLLFPRVGMGFLSFDTDNGRRVAGFGNNIRLGGFGTIREDPTVVLRVQPEELEDNPPARVFRLRGTSFDKYEDASWTRGFRGSPTRFNPRLGYFPIVRNPTASPTEQRVKIILDPLDEPVLFLPDGTIALKVPPRVENSIDVQRQLWTRPGLDIRYEDGDGLEQRYTAIIDIEERGRLVETLEADHRQHYLQLPPGTERVATLARQIAGAGPARDQAQRLLAWLRDSGELSYTLNQPRTHGRDPLEVFLFEAKRGHCEYFSSALAVMARTIGIPSRNVTGFLGGEYNNYGRYYAIRQGDAHSWVELYIDGAWVTYDPTPPLRGELPVDDGMFSELRAIMDALRTRWSEDVVGYDLRRQVEGLRRMYRWMRDFRDPGSEQERGGSPSSGSRGSGVVSIGALVVVPLVLGGLWLWRRRRKPARKRRQREGRDAVKLYRAMERRLQRLGHARPLSRTPQEHARVLGEQGFARAKLVDEITRAYEAARFGGASLDAQHLRELRQKLKEL